MKALIYGTLVLSVISCSHYKPSRHPAQSAFKGEEVHLGSVVRTTKLFKGNDKFHSVLFEVKNSSGNVRTTEATLICKEGHSHPELELHQINYGTLSSVSETQSHMVALPTPTTLIVNVPQFQCNSSQVVEEVTNNCVHILQLAPLNQGKTKVESVEKHCW